MKKIIKILSIILLLFISTGCSGNYDLKINKDLSIDEELTLTINKDNNTYQKTLNIFEKNNISKDNYTVVSSGDEIKITYKDSFTSFDDYIINSKVYHQLFDKIQYNKTKEYVDLYVSENLKIKNSNNNINGTNLTDFDVLQINIETPFKVKYSNEDMKSDNIYTWTINKNDTKKKIQMQFKIVEDKFPIRGVLVGSVLLIVIAIFVINVISRYRKSQDI